MDKEYSAAQERVSKLPLTEQEKAISTLSDLVYTLADRLVPVLTPEEASETQDAPTTLRGEADPVQSPIANTLSDNTSRIRRVNNKLSSLLERLEC